MQILIHLRRFPQNLPNFRLLKSVGVLKKIQERKKSFLNVFQGDARQQKPCRGQLNSSNYETAFDGLLFAKNHFAKNFR